MTAIDSHSEGGDHHGDHPPFLAHHFESPQQQFEAGKLGMWLFLATEFLLFGGLFCLYAVFRMNHPEMFAYGSKFLNTFWGATNTIILIASSLTMAMAVTASQQGRRRLLIGLLGLTFLGGVGFMCIKYVEYQHKFHNNIVWGTTFYEAPHHGDDHAHAAAGHADDHDESVGPGAPSETPAATPAEEEIDGVVITRSAVGPAAPGPAGLVPAAFDEADDLELVDAEFAGVEEPDPRQDPNRPPNAHIFFGIYFLMTGLHGIHVLVGMGVIGWLILRSVRGDFSRAYFTPVDLGGLYWHVVDLIWIFLFPLFYLIG